MLRPSLSPVLGAKLGPWAWRQGALNCTRKKRAWGCKSLSSFPSNPHTVANFASPPWEEPTDLFPAAFMKSLFTCGTGGDGYWNSRCC